MKIQEILTEDRQPNLMQAFKDFLPVAMKQLGIDKLPPIKLEKYVAKKDQPTFGRFVNKTKQIHLGIEDRHPLDILRTLAHELAHYKQLLDKKLDKDSGETGSPDENEAHVQAGIIMRKFDKKFPNYFKNSALDLD